MSDPWLRFDPSQAGAWSSGGDHERTASLVLHVHRAERTAELAAGLAAVLAEPQSDSFAAEIVAVPTRGVERWLAQRLSHFLGAATTDGVCANVLFPSPSRLLREALSAGSGINADDDPWTVGRTTWSLLDVINGCVGESWCDALTRQLDPGTEQSPGRRLTTAQRLARLFQTYAESRPQMLRDWVARNDTDGTGSEMPGDLTWQAELWRRLRTAIGVDSLAERLPTACESLRSDPGLVDLPSRVSLFGPTRLSSAELEVLVALAEHRDVHLWLPHPSPALWRSLTAQEPRTRRRRYDVSTELTRGPLLASLGRDVRELQLRLRAHGPGHSDEHIPADRALPNSVLGLLQQSIRDDSELPPAPINPHDKSLQVHACHGPARQVEVLREILVGLLENDPTLEPRDVLVMCPNIEDYAPLISATFGFTDPSDDDAVEAHPGHRLRVRLADRSLRQTNPMLDLLASLIELASSRVTASEVLDFAALPPVRRRFSLSDDDLELLQSWVVDSGVRWGLDARHRAPYGLEGVGQNTWRAGLDRILLGATMAEDDLRWLGTALPLDDVDSNDIDLAGRLAELITRLHQALDGLSGARPLSEWLTTLADALELLGEVGEPDAWQLAQAQRELAEMLVDAGATGSTLSLDLGDVHALMADRLAGRPTRANFRTGHLTMCSMLPMRSVPHRVICLLGLDDGAFPRSAGIDGDDVLAREPCIGERDPRSEDRQLLLDALLAAEDHLVILYTGADPRTNTERAPAVPVGEILDAVDTIATYDGSPARRHVVTRQPLQPFDERNFISGRLGVPRPFSFDRLALAGARQVAKPRSDDPAFLDTLLPAPDPQEEVALDDLIAFLEHPAKALLRQRLHMSVRGEDDNEPRDDLCAELNSLERWAVGERLLQDRLRGADYATCTQAEWRRGVLPPGALGKQVLGGLIDEVDPLVVAATPYIDVPGESIDAVADLGERKVAGTVIGVRGDAIVRVTFSRLGAKHRLRAWVQLLALTAAHPNRPWMAVTIGKGARGGAGVSTLPAPDPADARELLLDLIRLRDEGLRWPLPMAVKASSTYAELRQKAWKEESALSKSRSDWNGSNFAGEAADPAHVVVHGEGAPFDVLLAEPALVDPDETTRFGELARRIWAPILQREKAGTA